MVLTEQQERMERMRQGFQVYDITQLNEGTALFYEKNSVSGIARVVRMSMANGEVIDSVGSCFSSDEFKDESELSFQLNNRFMTGRLR